MSGKSTKRLHQLTSLRGIAAWWVVLYHSRAFLVNDVSPAFITLLSYGYLAVDLFYILSGFVLYLNYHATVLTDSPGSVFRFYGDRLARVYPVHFMMMMAYLVLVLAFIFLSSSGKAPETYTATAFIKSILLIQTWGGSGALSWNVPSWSISSEWAVYLLFPVIIYLFEKYMKGVASHFILAIFTCGLLITVYQLLNLHSIGEMILQMAIFRTFSGFLLGCILGSIYIHNRHILDKYRHIFLAIFLLLTLVFIFRNVSDFIVIPVIFFCLIAYLSVHVSFVTKTLLFWPLVYLGEISYSTYMVHYLVYDILKAGWVNAAGEVDILYVVASFLVVLVLSSLLHHLLEMPAQRYFRKKIRK